MALTEAEELELLELEAQEGGAQTQVPTEDLASFRESIEPGVMGDTNPTGQKILENLGTVAGGYGLGNIGARLGSAAIGSNLGQAIVRSPKSIGADIGKLESGKGVTGRLPELRGSTPEFPPPEMNLPAGGTPTSYPLDKNTFLNSAADRMTKWGNKLSPQEVTDYHRQISDWMNRGKILPNSPIGSIASKTAKQASSLQNELVPGREALSATYRQSKQIREGLKALAKYAALAAGGAGTAGLGYKMFQ